MLKDVTAAFAFSGAQVATADNQQFDTHSKSDDIFLAVINGSATNFDIKDDQNILRGVVPRYSQQSIFLSPRPINIQFHIRGSGAVQAGLASPFVLMGFSDKKLVDAMALVF